MIRLTSYVDLVTAKTVQLYTNTEEVPTLDRISLDAVPAVSTQNAAADELLPVTIEYDANRPEADTNVGVAVSAALHPAFNLQIDYEGSADMAEFFQKRMDSDPSTGKLKTFAWAFRVTPKSGSQFDFSFHGRLYKLHIQKPQSKQAECRVLGKIRVVSRGNIVHNSST